MKHILSQCNAWCGRRSRLIIFLMGVVLTLIVVGIDLISKDFFVREFYILAVIFVTWYAGLRTGCYTAIVVATAALALNVVENPHPSNFAVYYWKIVVNLVFFLAIAYLFAALQEALRAKSRFVSMVSHELRTPLAVIKESVLALRDGLLGEVNNRQREVLDRAAHNAQRLTRVITSILDFQKIEAGKMTPTYAESDIEELVREACEELTPFITKKGLTFSIEAAKGLPTVECDRDLITQVITNLLSNAIKFTSRGGIMVTILKEKDVVRVGVRDTGRGIRAVDMARLFKSFEQISEADPAAGKGTGLGLAISKEIVAMHGGRLQADSVYGSGSVFSFTLPTKRSE